MHNIFTKYRNVALMVGVIGLLLIAVLGYQLFKSDTKATTTESELQQAVVQGAPVDIVLDYYLPWLKSRQSTSSNPYQEGLASSSLLSPALRTRLVASEANLMAGLDPVLCQSATNTNLRISARLMNEQPDRAQVLILSKGLPSQAIVTLMKQGEGWFMNAIDCAAGEFELDREFSFEREGNLLKNVPKPLNSEYWHLVFTEDGKPGHTAPLFFDGSSTCLAVDGSASVCDTAKFREAIKASIQGEMSEIGVKVKKLKFLE